ncbi:MAG: hypothetical protein ACJ76I_05950 [Gaiellaceae bacterium]
MSEYTPEIYEDENGGQPFVKFFESLPKHKQDLLEATILERLSLLGIGLCQEKSHGRQLGGGLFEVKTEATESEVKGLYEDRDVAVPEGVGGDVLLRTFCHAFGEKRILLLHGYDKGLNPKHKKQQQEIEKARKHLKAWQQAQNKQKAADRKRPPTAADLATRAAAAVARTFAAWIEKFKKRKK